MSDTVSHLNVIKGYTRRWGKMTSQIHRLTLHLTGYYKETQQSRHNAWQQKIENKCLQNDDEKRVFFSISMFFFFPHYGTRRTMPCTNKNNDCNQRNALRIMHWHFRRTETYWLKTALLCARHNWLCFLHGVWRKWNKFCWNVPGNVRQNEYCTWRHLGQHHLSYWQQFGRSSF